MFSPRKTFLTALFALLCLASASVAQANTVNFYSTRAAFNAATDSQTTLTFEGIAPANDFVVRNSPTTIGDVTFSTVFGNSSSIIGLRIHDAGYQGGRYSLNSGATLYAEASTFQAGQGPVSYVTTATLPAGGATAIGMDLGGVSAFGGGSATVDVMLSNGQTQIVPLNFVDNPVAGQFFASPIFFGFTSDVAITSLSFSNMPFGSGLVIDNFSSGTAITGQEPPNPVPEPATMILLGTGLAGIGAKIRRRRQTKQM